MTLWYFFNLGLLGLPSSATSDTPREGQRALEPRGRSGAVPAPTASTRPPIHPGPAGRRPWRSRSLQPFPQGVSHSSAGNPNKALVPAGHGTTPRQPSPPWQQPPARGAVIPTWSNTASGQASSCWAAGSKRRVLFSCCHRFRPKCCFICLMYCFSRSAGGAAAALPWGRTSS